MKLPKTNYRCGYIAAAILALAACNDSLFAQENIVALGRVDAAGALISGETTVSGIIAPSRNSAGDYTVTVTAVGAFTGDIASDFVVQAAIASDLQGDDTIKATLTAVSDDVVTFTVKVDDVEGLINPDLQIAADSAFFFTLFRVPASFPVTTTPQYLLGSGIVLSSGVLASGTGAGGVIVTSSLNAVGDYNVTLSKPGGYVGDVSADYVLNLTIKGTGTGDRIVRGEVVDVTSNDSVVFNIHTDDVQAAIAADVEVPASSDFYFTAYRIPGSLQPNAGPNLVVALAGVDSTGTLLTAPNAFDGGTLSSIRNSLGDYRVTIVSSGAFAGRSANEFVVQAALSQSVSSDEGIMADVVIANNNTLHIDVNINDLQVTGQASGIAEDAPFSLMLVDSIEAADRVIQPDLRIGKTRNLSSMRGNDVYNVSGVGQGIRLRLTKNKWSKYSFALENDGSIPDTIRLNGTLKSRKLNTKYFQFDGKRKNITSQIKKGGSDDSLNPGKIIRYEGWVKYLSPRKRPRLEVNITARSLIDGTKVDAVRALVSSKSRKRGRR